MITLKGVTFNKRSRGYSCAGIYCTERSTGSPSAPATKPPGNKQQTSAHPWPPDSCTLEYSSLRSELVLLAHSRMQNAFG